MAFSDGQRLYSRCYTSSCPYLGVALYRWDANTQVCACASDVDYLIAVKTGAIPGSSSDSNVFAKLYGEKGDTGKMMLVVSTNNLGNYFETGRIDIFKLETLDIGQVGTSTV